MNRTAHTASTPPGKDNVNHLCLPDFGIAKLTVQVGNKASKSYQPAGAGNAPSSNTGDDSFHFAPSIQRAQIVYEIVDPFGVIKGAKLELFRRYKQDAVWSLFFGVFGPSWWAHGKHVVTWDGRVVQPDGRHDDAEGSDGYAHDLTTIAPNASFPGFPDGYVNLEHTTYKLKLTALTDGESGDPAFAWTYFHVLAEKIELEFGPRDVLPRPLAGKGDHRVVRDDIVRQAATPPPAGGGPIKVFLDSDIYKHSRKGTDIYDHEMGDNTLYRVYEALWGDGPLIPLFAKVTILDSTDHGVDAPKAIGNAKFLWDWTSASVPAATGSHSDAFVNSATDYRVNATKPIGRNCHLDRGGKRVEPARAAASAVFPAQSGYAPKDPLDDGQFPFKVEPISAISGGIRKWSAYSYAWRDKSLAGKTGVLFRPSRMAGDSYAVSVYLAWDVDETGKNVLDVDDDSLVVPQPARVSKSTGTYEVWRRTHLIKHLTKTNVGMPAVNLATICSCYTHAFMEVKNDAAAPVAMAAADWNAAIAAEVAKLDEDRRHVVDPSIDQHVVSPVGVFFRSRDEYTVAWKKARIGKYIALLGAPLAHATDMANAAGAAATEADAGAQAQARAAALGYGRLKSWAYAKAAEQGWSSVQKWMDDPKNGFSTLSDYAGKLHEYAIAAVINVFDARFDPNAGITIFQVSRPHNRTGDMAGYTIGLAHDFPSVQGDANRSRCAFLLMCPVGAVACGVDKISAHEIGHHFFLPHPMDTGENHDYHAHDQTLPSLCLMSYNYHLAMELCGLCHLRLRGWTKDRLSTVAANNSAV